MGLLQRHHKQNLMPEYAITSKNASRITRMCRSIKDAMSETFLCSEHGILMVFPSEHIIICLSLI